MCQNLSIKVNVFFEVTIKTSHAHQKLQIQYHILIHKINRDHLSFFWLTGAVAFSCIQPITMHILAKRHCDWLTIRKVGAPEIQKARKA